jgi:predicted AAA+ superfamily ATPase
MSESPCLPRTIQVQIMEALNKDRRVIIIYGPRQSGKTTLLSEMIKDFKEKPLTFSGDDLYVQQAFSVHALDPLKQLVGGAKLIVIDEAQRIPNIGLSLKLLYDHTQVKVIATGSSTFDLANKLQEPLTGRTRQFQLFPFSYEEIQILRQPSMPARELLEEKLRFGMYPKSILLEGEQEKQDYLFELLNGYLYKDLLIFESVRKPKKVIDLLTLLALQIGSEVSVLELAEKLSISKITVENYLDILEKMFVIFNLRGFSRNLRKEVYKTSKYYFVDLGLRNALIRNFNRMSLRSDVGELFENFCIIERIKFRINHNLPFNRYFWRTYDRKEVDLVEESEGIISGYEFKWRWGGKAGNRKEFESTYPGSKVSTIQSEDFEEFIIPKRKLQGSLKGKGLLKILTEERQNDKAKEK